MEFISNNKKITLDTQWLRKMNFFEIANMAAKLCLPLGQCYQMMYQTCPILATLNDYCPIIEINIWTGVS